MLNGVNETVIRLTASSLGMPENSRQQTTLTLSSNGGNHTVELAYQVPRQRRQRGLPDLQQIVLTFIRHVNPCYLVTVGILVLFIANLTFCHNAGEIPFGAISQRPYNGLNPDPDLHGLVQLPARSASA